MKINRKDSRDAVKTIINIVNGITGSRLTTREINIFTEFLLLKPNTEHTRYSPKSKKKVMKICKELYDYDLNQKNISPTIIKLNKTKFIYKEEDSIVYTNKGIRNLVQKLLDNNNLELKIEIKIVDGNISV